LIWDFAALMKTQLDIVVLDASTLDRGDLDFSGLQRLGKVTFHPVTQKDEVLDRASVAEIVLTNKVVLNAEILVKLPQLRMIAICATGTNNVDLVAAKERGIHVANVAGYATQSVAQHTMTFILNWATQIHRFTREPKAWPQSPVFTRLDYPVMELAGRTLGLIGTGRIGQEVGRLATAFGMVVHSWDRTGSSKKQTTWPRLPLRKLFEISDVISLHCSLTESTRHIINRESLGWMKSGAFLVNTGRGDLVDEQALKEALLSGKPGGAGLDVLSMEPPSAQHPLIELDFPNLLITPHTAWTAQEARRRLLNEVVANIEAFLRGIDRNRVA